MMRKITLVFSSLACLAFLSLFAGCSSDPGGASDSAKIATATTSSRGSRPMSAPMAGSAMAASADASEEHVGAEAMKASEAAVEASPTRGSAAKNVLRTRTQVVAEPQNISRAVHREAEVALRVKDVDKSNNEIESLANSVGGYVQTSSFVNSDGQNPTSSLTVEVPVAEFTDVLTKICQSGTLLSKQVVADDKTAEMLVLSNELKATKDANTAASIKNQQDSLVAQVRFSSIRITLSQDVTAHPKEADPSWSQEQMGYAGRAFMDVARVLVTGVIWIGVMTPFWAIPVIGFIMFQRVLKKRFPKKPMAP